MATVDRTTTTTEIGLLYADNCGYEEDADAAKASAFITVCRSMLARGITTIEHNGSRMQFSAASLRALIDEARAYVSSQSAGRVKHASFENFRS